MLSLNSATAGVMFRTSLPDFPIVGDLFYDERTATTKYYIGDHWVDISTYGSQLMYHKPDVCGYCKTPLRLDNNNNCAGCGAPY